MKLSLPWKRKSSFNTDASDLTPIVRLQDFEAMFVGADAILMVLQRVEAGGEADVAALADAIIRKPKKYVRKSRCLAYMVFPEGARDHCSMQFIETAV